MSASAAGGLAVCAGDAVDDDAGGTDAPAGEDDAHEVEEAEEAEAMEDEAAESTVAVGVAVLVPVALLLFVAPLLCAISGASGGSSLMIGTMRVTLAWHDGHCST